MALYHFHVTQISRGKGQTAVSAAAYRAGQKLYDSYYGETADYTHKSGVIAAEIITPDFVPKSFHNREILWNAVEKTEKHPKAQLAYSFDIALMNELTQEENWNLAKRFVRENFVAKGMICDIAFHQPEKDGIDNPHFHVICPIRPMNEDGTWGEKQRREYLLNEKGEHVLDEKGKPKFNAIPTTDWGRPETLEAWREAWAKLVNETFREKGINAAIDHRSYKDQGIDLIPQIHEGPRVRQMEKKGIRTEKGNMNRLISDINRKLKTLSVKLKEIIEAIATISKELDELPPEPKIPTLYECLRQYFDDRNAVADSYSYGKQKAKLTNTKRLAQVLCVLEENHITTVDELMAFAQGKASEARVLAKANNDRKARITEIKETLRYNAWYLEGLPIMKQIENAKFTKRKEKIKNENQDVLNRFYVARRILTERKQIGKVDGETLRKEMAELEKESGADYEKYRIMSREVKELQDICSYSQKAIHKKKEIKREEPSL